MITSMCMNMHCNIDMLYMYMAGFLLIIKVDSFSQPCDSSRQTIEVVQHCPNDPDSYRKAAARKNCSGQQHVNCSSFEYHCVLNDQENETVEVCAPSIFIIGKVCAKFNLHLKSIFRIDGRSCNESDPPCGYRYNSTESYKFSGCFDFSKPKIPIRTEKSQSLSTGGVVGIILAVLTIFAIIFFISWKIYQRKKRNQHTWSQEKITVQVPVIDQKEETEELLSTDQNTSSNVSNGQANENVHLSSPNTPRTEDFTDTANEPNQASQKTHKGVPVSDPDQEGETEGETELVTPPNAANAPIQASQETHEDVESNSISFSLSPSRENQSDKQDKRTEEGSNVQTSDFSETTVTKQPKNNHAQVSPSVKSNSDMDGSNIKGNPNSQTKEKYCSIEIEENESDSAETSQTNPLQSSYKKAQVHEHVKDNSSYRQLSIHEDTCPEVYRYQTVTSYFPNSEVTNTVTAAQPVDKYLEDPKKRQKADTNSIVGLKKSKIMMPRKSKTDNLKESVSFEENKRDDCQESKIDKQMYKDSQEKILNHIKDLYVKYEDQQKELDTLSEMKAQIELMNEKLTKLQEEMKCLTAERERLRKEVESLSDERDKIKQSKLEKDKQHDKEIQQKDELLQQKQDTIEEKDRLIDSQRNEIKTLKEQIQKLNENIKKLTERPE